MTLSVWFHENKSTSMADAGAREMKKKGKEKGKESALIIVNVKNRKDRIKRTNKTNKTNEGEIRKLTSLQKRAHFCGLWSTLNIGDITLIGKQRRTRTDNKPIK
jgi:hypothetical protein